MITNALVSNRNKFLNNCTQQFPEMLENAQTCLVALNIQQNNFNC